MEKIVITKLKCLRCGHTWHPKTESMPKLCPSCKSKYWNEERKDVKKIGNTSR